MPIEDELLTIDIFLNTPKMDFVFELLHQAMPAVYVLAALAFIIKFILVINNKGFDLVAVVISFFKVYNKSQRNTASPRRRAFMKFNNLLNYILYGCIILFLLLLLIFQGNMFTPN